MIDRAGKRLVVASDALGRAHGEALAVALRAAGYSIGTVELREYPNGDGLPALLATLAERADACLAVVSSSPRAISWLARELSIEHLYPSWFLAIAPGVAGWQGRVDAGSFRVLAPSEGVVARMDERFSPATRPAADPPLGVSVPFDPAWLVRTVADRRPDRPDVASALADCTATRWESAWYQAFGAAAPGARRKPSGEVLVVADWQVGLVSIHLGVDGRVAGIGYLSRTPSR